MSLSYSCDGCGKRVEDPTIIGSTLKREYCEECAKRAEAFVEAEDALRRETFGRFNTDRDLLIASASEGGFHLPDVPNAG